MRAKESDRVPTDNRVSMEDSIGGEHLVDCYRCWWPGYWGDDLQSEIMRQKERNRVGRGSYPSTRKVIQSKLAHLLWDLHANVHEERVERFR